MDCRGFSSPLFLPLPDGGATARLGAWLAGRLGAGDALLLGGEIGAGKTHLSRALIGARLAAAGMAEEVPSPTYTLVQTYRIPGSEPAAPDGAAADALEIWHADLYRLGDPGELAELGIEDAFETALCLVEWPDRLGDIRPEHALMLYLDIDGEARVARVSASGARMAEILAALAAQWPGASGSGRQGQDANTAFSCAGAHRTAGDAAGTTGLAQWGRPEGAERNE